MPVAYNMACEAPWDFGWVMAAETLLSCGSSFWEARKVEVDERDRLVTVSGVIEARQSYLRIW
jgi:hypothetical protein